MEHDMILEIQCSYRQVHCWDVTRTTPLSQAIKDVDRDTGLYNKGEVWLPLLVTSWSVILEFTATSHCLYTAS